MTSNKATPKSIRQGELLLGMALMKRHAADLFRGAVTKINGVTVKPAEEDA